MAKILSLHGLKTLRAAREAERDDLIHSDRVAIAKERAAKWARNRALEDLATALLHAEHAENQSLETVERIRRHA
jgi:hypothetical protein